MYELFFWTENLFIFDDDAVRTKHLSIPLKNYSEFITEDEVCRGILAWIQMYLSAISTRRFESSLGLENMGM